MRVLEHTSFLRKKHMLFALLFALRPMVAMGVERVLNVGGTAIALSETCDSEHKLNVLYNGTTYCAPATTETLTNTLHVLHNGTTYSICNGSCGSGGYVMPETPPEPIELPETCEWTQTNENAYLLSDGNQYYDTGAALNPENNVEVTLQVVNGQSARIFGSMGASCTYDMTIRNDGVFAMRMGSGAVTKKLELDDDVRVAKNVIRTETSNKTRNYKNIYVNDTKVISSSTASRCTSTYPFLILKNNFISVTDDASGGIKLYRIRLWDEDDNLIHDYRPVAAGTNICGHVAQTNAMWDFVTKELYYPAGTGQMGYGVDP